MIMSDKKKEEVEKLLLAAMKNIDKAKAMIGFYDEYSPAYQELSTAYDSSKRVLNRHFDTCARNK